MKHSRSRFYSVASLTALSVVLVTACSSAPDPTEIRTEAEDLSVGFSLLISNVDGTCLSPNGGVPGSKLTHIACNDLRNAQGWAFRPSGTLKSATTGTAVCVGSGGKPAGSAPAMATCSGTAPGQKYAFAPVRQERGATWGHIVAGASGLCLTNSGVHPILAACDNANGAQLWRQSGCGAGMELCSGHCIDPMNDGANCGSCGHACTSEQHCSQGACAWNESCPTGEQRCPGFGSTCFNLKDDERHCGKCETACTANQTCKAGACIDPPGSCDYADGVHTFPQCCENPDVYVQSVTYCYRSTTMECNPEFGPPFNYWRQIQITNACTFDAARKLADDALESQGYEYEHDGLCPQTC